LKKILYLLLVTLSLYADTGIYIGTSVGMSNENFDELDAQSSSNIALLTIGYGDIQSYAIELSFEYTINDSNIFSTNGNDGDKQGFNIALIKSFPIRNYAYPYIRAGFGSGTMKIQRTTQSKLSYGSYNLGLGLYVPIYKHINLDFAYLYKDTSYERINLIASQKNYTSKINTFSFGIEYRF